MLLTALTAKNRCSGLRMHDQRNAGDPETSVQLDIPSGQKIIETGEIKMLFGNKIMTCMELPPGRNPASGFLQLLVPLFLWIINPLIIFV